MEGLSESRSIMSDNIRKDYTEVAELYQRKEAYRKTAAKRPVSEKMSAVLRLRDFERKLENIRQINRAKRAAKQIRIAIKTR